MSPHQHQIEKLRGSDNYEDWRFAVEAYFQMRKLWKSILGTEENPEKLIEAKSELILLVEKSNYPHIRSCETAKDIWEKLSTMFQDTGLVRKVSLIQKFCSTKLEDFSSIEAYTNEVLNNAHKLRGVGLNLDEEWTGSIMLAGLPDQYKPMIMGIQSSGIPISGDSIKMKILQDVKCDVTSEAAFTGRFNPKNKKKKSFRGPKCYNCQGFGHYASKCTSKKSNEGKSQSAMFGSFAGIAMRNDEWYFDSGVSAHMCSDDKTFSSGITPNAADVVVANNTSMAVKGVGDVEMSVKIEDSQVSDVKLHDVLYVLDLCTNLLSISKIVSQGNKVLFDKKGCEVTNTRGEVIAKGDHIYDMFRLTSMNDKPVTYLTRENKIDHFNLWHKRVGHVSEDVFKKMINGAVTGISSNVKKDKCSTCIKSKITRKPFNESGYRAKQMLELVHSDVCGPMEEKSFGGSRYMLLFLDDFSRKVFVYMIKSKEEVAQKFLEFKYFTEKQTGFQIKALRSDNGTEYCNSKMQKILSSSGIQHQRTVCYSPEQNGMAERMNRTLIEKARCLLMDAGLEKKFWAEAINTAAYLVNRTPCKGLQDTTPEEMWSGRKPDLKHLKVFGCQAIIHIPKEKRKKLDPKGKDVIFVGYLLHPKSYRFFDPKKKEFLTSRDAVFFENQYFKSTCEVENIYNTLPICDSVGEQEPDFEEEEHNYVENQTDDEVFVIENDDDIFFSQYEDDSETNSEGIAHPQEVEAVEPQPRRSWIQYLEGGRTNYL